MNIIRLCIASLIVSLMACNQHEHGTSTHQHTSDSSISAKDVKITALELNRGAKWKLDEPTRQNMTGIRQIIDSAASEPVINNNKLAGKLEESTNKLISECRMKGKDHDMLHQWLEGYLGSLKQLKEAKDTDTVSFKALNDQLLVFHDYFE